MTTPPLPPASNDPSRDATNGPQQMPENPLPAWFNRRKPGELSDEQLALFIGPRWESAYRKKLAGFRADPSFVPTWNWAAALAPSGLWFLYRKLYLAFAAFFIIPSLAVQWLTGTDQSMTMANLNSPENAWLRGMYVAVYVSTVLAGGGTANWLLFRRARAAIKLVELQELPEPESVRLLQRIGGVNRGGLAFMVAIVVMSALAAFRG
ncbi:MAG: hypothetical protein V4617_12730 [Gemmatimonadota bacterium]